MPRHTCVLIRSIAVDLKVMTKRIAPGQRILPTKPSPKMWTAIVFLPLLSFCLCEQSFAALRGRGGVQVVHVSRLSSEQQCRQACQSPAASGTHPCNWSVPYQNHCILLQCHQLSVCQNAGEEDLKDLLAGVVRGRRDTALFHHQHWEGAGDAEGDPRQVFSLAASPAWAPKGHLRHLLETESKDGTTNASRTIATTAAASSTTAAASSTTAAASSTTAAASSTTAAASSTTAAASSTTAAASSTTAAASSTTAAASSTTSTTAASTTAASTTTATVTNASVFSTTYGTTAKAPSTSGGSHPAEATTVAASSSTSANNSNQSASSSSHATEPGLTVENSGHTSPASASSSSSAAPPVPSEAPAGILHPTAAAAAPSTMVTTLSSEGARIPPTAPMALGPQGRTQPANPLPGTTVLSPEAAAATTSSGKAAAPLGWTGVAESSPPASPAGATTAHGLESASLPASPADASKTTASGLADTQDTDSDYLLVAAEPLTQYLVDRSSLLAVLLVGTGFFITVLGLFLMQAYESYKKKDYTQVDYLINGMYVDSEM
ncbi:uncharacterized protein C11orf24 homolog isoform X1 [Pogoniulus pusillus]|uniref:uncharacterized protein C11orf24 homolog isoform X1 n=1 Tax=Pogoniulus pusillus TaxID=488313 RepID=UPI0030B9A672